MKYDPSGTQLWSRVIDSGAREIGCLIGADSLAGVYVVGQTTGVFDSAGDAPVQDVFVAKYDTAGNRLWTRQGTSIGADSIVVLSAMTVDHMGQVYLTGHGSDNGLATLCVLKLDSSGARQWQRKVGVNVTGPGGGVAVDSLGAIYSAGVNFGGLDGTPVDSSAQAFLVKHDASGNELWVRQVGTPAGDYPQAVGIDGTRVYVVGYSYGAFRNVFTDLPPDLFLVRYSGDGTLTDVRTYGARDYEDAAGVATDGAGAVYVVGTKHFYRTGLVLKYRP